MYSKCKHKTTIQWSVNVNILCIGLFFILIFLSRGRRAEGSTLLVNHRPVCTKCQCTSDPVWSCGLFNLFLFLYVTEEHCCCNIQKLKPLVTPFRFEINSVHLSLVDGLASSARWLRTFFASSTQEWAPC